MKAVIIEVVAVSMIALALLASGWEIAPSKVGEVYTRTAKVVGR